MSAEQGTILVLPEGERAKQLELKRDEYKARWDSQLHQHRFEPPEVLRATSADWYAWFIANALVENGRVDSFEISREMSRLNDGLISGPRFNGVFDVIKQYVETGIANGKPLPPIRV